MESGRLARPCPCLRIIVVHTRFAYPAIAPAQSPLPGHAHNLPSPLPQNPVFSAVAAHHVSSAESPPPGRHRRPHSAPAISVRFGNTGWRGFCHSKTEPNISVDPVTPSLGPFLHFFVLGLPISCMISVADLESALSATPIWKSPCQTIPTQNCSCTPIKKA
ncbi:uncharacterized protein [Zea mays]|uniref:uncharacterized protein n=1 Tax=Zea mays TaxID=4577 RepID=UPI0004DEC7A2|nr:uncharacterized protein LOC111589923 [Zea mays]|eukprot:XP_023156576.1 uncharacterized protein LOC111589923 [Zea mays]